MAIAGSSNRKSNKEVKLWKLCPLWQSSTLHNSSSTSSTQNLSNYNHHGYSTNNHPNHQSDGHRLNSRATPSTVSSVARSLFPARRRLRLDPSNHLYFPYEPGKQVRSAVKIKNSSKSYVAFKFQTTSPKSCYMRPPGSVLAPGEILITTVFKFVEQPESNEKPLDLKTKVKFKIMSLKVKEGTEYVPELFDEQKDNVTVERVLRVVFTDPDSQIPAMEKLKRQLAEADAAVDTRKKPPADNGPKVVGEGLVINEWKERREKYLARQQVEAADTS